MSDFYTYLHARPNGTIFYVGKGKERRAWDFAPSRRTKWHLNIVNKYGRDNIIISIIPAETETQSFKIEKRIIAGLKEAGHEIINLTDGGEGAVGRVMSEAQELALAKGRGKDRQLTEDAKQRILKGLEKGRKVASLTWHQSKQGKQHIKELGHSNADRIEKMEPWAVTCCVCGCEFETKSYKAQACSKRCSQIEYRKNKREAA